MQSFEQELHSLEEEILLEQHSNKLKINRLHYNPDIDYIVHLCPACRGRQNDTFDLLFKTTDPTNCRVAGCSNSLDDKAGIDLDFVPNPSFIPRYHA